MLRDRIWRQKCNLEGWRPRIQEHTITPNITMIHPVCQWHTLVRLTQMTLLACSHTTPHIYHSNDAQVGPLHVKFGQCYVVLAKMPLTWWSMVVIGHQVVNPSSGFISIFIEITFVSESPTENVCGTSGTSRIFSPDIYSMHLVCYSIYIYIT